MVLGDELLSTQSITNTLRLQIRFPIQSFVHENFVRNILILNDIAMLRVIFSLF